MKIIITREDNFINNHYCVLEFKGKFQTDELPTKGLVHLGTLQQISEDMYRLEIGIMDLVGKSTKMQDGWLYTQTKQGQNLNQKIVVIKGVISKKILFDKRPCPNMQRSQIEPKMLITNALFKQLQIKGEKNNDKAN